MAELNWRSNNSNNSNLETADTIATNLNIGTSLNHDIIASASPIFKALTMIIIFIVSNLGYSPLGCKTQYLFSNKFWYNKQLVIFFVIYFVINLRSNASHGASPNDLFIISLFVWILYNVASRLGETWAIMQSPFWPGPLTWFGVLTFPLIILFIINDARKYYITIDKVDKYDSTIKILYHSELVLMFSIISILVVGFIKSYQEQSNRWGKRFKFWQYFFGVNDSKNPATQCDKDNFREYAREIEKATNKPVTRNSTNVKFTSLLPEIAILVSIIFSITFLPGIITKLTPLFERPKEANIQTGKSWRDTSENITK